MHFIVKTLLSDLCDVLSENLQIVTSVLMCIGRGLIDGEVRLIDVSECRNVGRVTDLVVSLPYLKRVRAPMLT